MRVIEFHRDHTLPIELDEGRIVCNWLGYRKRFWEDLTVVGPDLVERKVLGVEDRKFLKNVACWLFLNPLMSVRLLYGEATTLSLDELKRRVTTYVTDSSLWSAGRDPAELRVEIAAAKTFDELWEAMR